MGTARSNESGGSFLRDTVLDPEAGVAEYPGSLAIGQEPLPLARPGRENRGLGPATFKKYRPLLFQVLVIFPVSLAALIVKKVIRSIVEIFSDDAPEVSNQYEGESKVQYQPIDTRE